MLLFIQLAIVVALVFLFLGSIEDLRTGEIPEKISYGYIVSALVISAVDSIVVGDVSLLVNSLFMGVCFLRLDSSFSTLASGVEGT